MGPKTNGRLIYIVSCLLIAAFLIYLKPSAYIHGIKIPLSKAFQSIDGWETFSHVEMDQEIVSSLELDDYLFSSFRKDHRTVSLYIGYYRTADKVGSAHSPLVCFPGQGWEISVPQNIELKLETGKIHAEKLIAGKGRQKELLMYWFQSYDMTSGGTFQQKIQNFWGRLHSKPEDNAFVRVSVPIHDDNHQAALKTAVDFVQDFYPHFLKYITT